MNDDGIRHEIVRGDVSRRPPVATSLWAGAGAIANEKGDIFGSKPTRVITWGKAVIAREWLHGALDCGWRELPKTHPEADPDFAWIERTAEERDAR